MYHQIITLTRSVSLSFLIWNYYHLGKKSQDQEYQENVRAYITSEG